MNKKNGLPIKWIIGIALVMMLVGHWKHQASMNIAASSRHPVYSQNGFIQFLANIFGLGAPISPSSQSSKDNNNMPSQNNSGPGQTGGSNSENGSVSQGSANGQARGNTGNNPNGNSENNPNDNLGNNEQQEAGNLNSVMNAENNPNENATINAETNSQNTSENGSENNPGGNSEINADNNQGTKTVGFLDNIRQIIDSTKEIRILQNDHSSIFI